MANKGAKSLDEAFRALAITRHTARRAQLLPQHSSPSSRYTTSTTTTTRAMATTTTPAPLITRPSSVFTARSPPHAVQYTHYQPLATIPLTIYAFPSLQPLHIEHWSTKHLHLPLRRDILHSAVVFEGDATRQGTADSKTRWEIHGSHRKIYRQKGTGRARMGMKQSPIRKGGGKTFGPTPRDFSTGLNKKVYDLAWRTALSYRYRRGQLVVVEDGMELPLPEEFLSLSQEKKLTEELEDGFVAKYMRTLLGDLEWGKDHGRTLFITGDRRPNLYTAMEVAGEQGRAMEVDDVDVKNLLEQGRIVVEKSALKEMIGKHQSDLITNVFINGQRQMGPPVGDAAVDVAVTI